jgi:hypothetical protein
MQVSLVSFDGAVIATGSFPEQFQVGANVHQVSIAANGWLSFSCSLVSFISAYAYL